MKTEAFWEASTCIRHSHLGPIQVIRLNIGWFIPLGFLGKRNRRPYKSEIIIIIIISYTEFS